MHKLRQAAVVAAMVGSVSMFGAGVAAAGGGGGWDGPDTINCKQDAGHNVDQTGLVNLNEVPIAILAGTSSQDTEKTNQNCSIDNEF
ncbi:MAG: hypothetical protein ACRDP3_01210 [Streptomyces sp.]|uniref:hypothetical protein n=1 Tax=Streptomyces sp. TaxID=1931 RepID=UPI003D6A6F17